jgi:hypothetical protein
MTWRERPAGRPEVPESRSSAIVSESRHRGRRARPGLEPGQVRASFTETRIALMLDSKVASSLELDGSCGVTTVTSGSAVTCVTSAPSR